LNHGLNLSLASVVLVMFSKEKMNMPEKEKRRLRELLVLLKEAEESAEKNQLYGRFEILLEDFKHRLKREQGMEGMDESPLYFGALRGIDSDLGLSRPPKEPLSANEYHARLMRNREAVQYALDPSFKPDPGDLRLCP
jgi:hypothetical protein